MTLFARDSCLFDPQLSKHTEQIFEKLPSFITVFNFSSHFFFHDGI